MQKKRRPLRAMRSNRKQTSREMDKVALGWMINYARTNLWRVDSDHGGIYGLDDLIQEGHWCWQYVLNRYPKAKDPPHLMSLFKLTFHSHITNLANRKTKDATIAAFFALEPDNLQPEEASLHALLKNAPENVRLLLEFVASEEGRRKLRRCSHLRRRNGTRETADEFYGRLLGVPIDTEVFRDYFSPA